MIIYSYGELPHIRRPDSVEMTDFFNGFPAGENVRMGFGVFPPGMEAPPATHDEDEYAFVLSGSVKARIGGEVFVSTAGCASFIPAGEEHVSFNDGDEECKVVWFLVKKPD